MNDVITVLRRCSLAATAFVVILNATIYGSEGVGVIVERTSGAVLVVDTYTRALRRRVTGLGDLSNASVEFFYSYAFVFGCDGGLSKVDLYSGEIVSRTLQAGNSVGGAISRDGRLVAVANYMPGGVRVFETDTLSLVADIPAITRSGISKVVGLAAIGPQQFVFSLYEAGEIWLLDLVDIKVPIIRRYEEVGRYPYDSFLSLDRRYYVAGLFGEAAMALLDLWRPEAGVRRILENYRGSNEILPVYNVPHLTGWTAMGTSILFPAVGAHEILVTDTTTWTLQGRIPVIGQPVFVVSHQQEGWITFALPENDTIQIIDTDRTHITHIIKPGNGVAHIAFTPDWKEVWISLRDENKVVVYNADTREKAGEIQALAPSGIFLAGHK